MMAQAWMQAVVHLLMVIEPGTSMYGHEFVCEHARVSA